MVAAAEALQSAVTDPGSKDAELGYLIQARYYIEFHSLIKALGKK